MRFMKRVLACALAAMLVVPSMSAMATELPDNNEQAVSVDVAEEPAGTDVPEVPAEPVQPLNTEGQKTDASTDVIVPEEEQKPAETVDADTPAEPVQSVNPEKPKADADTAAPETNDPAEETVPEVPAGTEAPKADESADDETGKLTVSDPSENPEEQAQPEAVSDEEKTADMDEVQYNTGSFEVHVLNEEAYNALEDEAFDEAFYDTFDEDGNYTINITEANPFFPYEVQFSHDGETTNEWFMSPDDTVEVGGHTFAVSAYMDGTAVTQMSLEVGGDTIVVYPEEKEFTNDGGISMFSLIPLERRYLDTVYLTGYSPIELTMVGVNAILGDNVPSSEDTKIAWKRYDSWDETAKHDDYTISGIQDKIDLSYTERWGSVEWEFIVGDADQLNSNNIRYVLPVETTWSDSWLKTAFYGEDEYGKRSELTSRQNSYANDEYITNTGKVQNRVDISSYLVTREMQDKEVYAGLLFNKSAFERSSVENVKVVRGVYANPLEAVEALKSDDLTAQFMCSDMMISGAGYKTDYENFEEIFGNDDFEIEISLLGYNSVGELLGVLPVRIELNDNSDYIHGELYAKENGNDVRLGSTGYYSVSERDRNMWIEINEKYSLTGKYSLVLELEKKSGENYPDISHVYVGKFESVADAVAKGAADIKDSIVGDIGTISGYTADYSSGVQFTIFFGEDGNENQVVQRLTVYTEHFEPSEPQEPSKRHGATVSFDGLKDADGKTVDCYIVDSSDDSYGEKNYVTILIDEKYDLNAMYAPVFSGLSSGATLLAEGSSKPEESGISLHSFAEKPVHYTVSAEDGENAKQYWVQIKKVDSGRWGALYVTSLDDIHAESIRENGVVYSTREVMLDSYHNYIHDILVANIGKDSITALTAELSSDTVELDPYWTLNGQQALAGMTEKTVETGGYYSKWDPEKQEYVNFTGELPNLAKLRLRAKEGAANGSEISGTLTIKSGDKILMVLKLTGMIGDPCITTMELPEAVKYVPYGAMIQNSNKYSWIKANYSWSGDLPDGMEVLPNGELYGVPTETGTYTFTVGVQFSALRENYNFPTQYAELTLTIKENTDDNVFYETDAEEGYVLSTPIGTDLGGHYFYLEQIVDSLFVSEGVLPEFKALWLNGEKLVEGTDYAAVSGSTRITVSAQTLQNKADKNGRNTIAAEFRVDGDENKDLRRTAQNFYLNKNNGGGNGGGGHSSHSGSGSSGSSDGSGSGSSTPLGVTIRGRLVDGNNNAMAGVTVELHSTPRTTVTDASGYFQFTGVEYGQHELFAKDAAGNVVASRKFELREGGTSAFANDVFTAPNGTVVNMTVTVADGVMTFSNVLFAAAQTGDDTNVAGWILALLLSCAALAGMAVYKKKRRLS